MSLSFWRKVNLLLSTSVGLFTTSSLGTPPAAGRSVASSAGCATTSLLRVGFSGLEWMKESQSTALWSSAERCATYNDWNLLSFREPQNVFDNKAICKYIEDAQYFIYLGGVILRSNSAFLFAFSVPGSFLLLQEENIWKSFRTQSAQGCLLICNLAFARIKNWTITKLWLITHLMHLGLWNACNFASSLSSSHVNKIGEIAPSILLLTPTSTAFLSSTGLDVLTGPWEGLSTSEKKKRNVK